MFSFYTELKVSITVSGLVEIWEIGFVSKINWQTKYISQNQRYVYRKIHFDITQLSMQPDGTLLLAKSKFSISKIWRKKKRVRWLMWAIPLYVAWIQSPKYERTNIELKITAQRVTHKEIVYILNKSIFFILCLSYFYTEYQILYSRRVYFP